MWKKIVLLFGFMLVISSAGAQKGLSVDTLFNDYGRSHGSVLINLGKDVLGEHTQIDRYKCLVINAETNLALRIEKAIRHDFVKRGCYGNGIIIKEIHKNGHLSNASYALGKDNISVVTEYILYSRNNDKITLVYLSGRFTSRQLNSELDKLKNLFIKVYNKQL
ncbi:MAG: hypothetical protein LBD80_08905 [Tannerella sp.]|jgi:hypothetical protein|nr:hypothetical protein [Tannerella sp.]